MTHQTFCRICEALCGLEKLFGSPDHLLYPMVSAYREANGAAIYCSTGVNMGGNGGLAFCIQMASIR